MRRTKLFIKTLKEDPKDEVSRGIKLLIRAGFVNKTGAGIYSYLPLGLRALKKIEDAVREAMIQFGAFEILMPALHPQSLWKQTGRWETFDALFKTKTRRDHQEFGLGPTHEEIVVPLMKNFISSYKDLPIAVFQIQTKFRDEARPKSGLLRGREFLMKDLYSFHSNEKDADDYYEKAALVYEKIFKTLGLKTIRTRASGGTFSKFSDEFQAPSEVGEDTVHLCKSCQIAFNQELMDEKAICLECKNKNLETFNAIEVGNIFKLKTKFSESFDLRFKDKEGDLKLVIMGCYGIGISRLLGAISETLSDEKGLIFSENTAPFKAHLISIAKNRAKAETIYQNLQKAGIEVLYDDREEANTGEKLVEADLFGAPWRLVISEKTLKENKIEIKKRGEKELKLMREKEAINLLK